MLDDLDMKDPATKATVATLVFSLVGIVSFFVYAQLSSYLLPNAIFYAVLIVNTFFSIRFFSRIAPENTSQVIVDTILVLLYFGLALSMGRPIQFAFFALCIFIVASVKYALLFRVIRHIDVLKRKIRIDLIGTTACAAVLGLTILGPAFEAAWLAAIGFIIANVYLFFIRPMYRL